MTNNLLQVYTYKEHHVRTTEIDGEIWFVAADVCEILELTDVSMATRSLDEDEKGTSKVCTPGGKQDMTIISEAGVYALVMKSRKPEAKQFSRWVRHEVLPQIRRTGSYNANIAFDPMQGAKAVFEPAGIKDNQLALAMDKVYRSYTGHSALEAGEIALTAPSKQQILTPTEIGEHFGLKVHRVNEILAEAGYQHNINRTPVRQLKCCITRYCVLL